MTIADYSNAAFSEPHASISEKRLARLERIEKAAKRWCDLRDATTEAAPGGARSSNASPEATHSRAAEIAAEDALRKAVHC